MTFIRTYLYLKLISTASNALALCRTHGASNAAYRLEDVIYVLTYKILPPPPKDSE